MSFSTSEETTSGLSENTAPLPLRNPMTVQPERQEPQDSQVTHDVVDMPTPDPNWCFNGFLVDLANEINGDELDKLKNMFIDIIGRGILGSITTALELFDHLRRRLYLSRGNLLYLQTILRKLNRPELIQMAIEYARKAGSVLHFHEAPGEPLNGYTAIKFHVEGKDFRNCTTGYIQSLRFKVAALLFIPAHDVIIAGVEPSSSMLITVMIPDVYADILEKMLTKKEPMEELVDLEIDTVKIGDNVYNIRGIEGAEIIETEQQTKLVSVYHQLQNKSWQLERMAEESTNLSNEKRIVERKLNELEAETVALKLMFYKSDKRPASLASQSAFVQFKQSLNEVKARNYDSKIIRNLLQANALIIAFRARDENNTKIKRLQLDLEDLRLRVVPVFHELEILRLTESRSIDQMLRDSLLQLLESIAASAQQVKHTLTDVGHGILKKLSQSLRYRDRQKLEKKYTWKPDDKLTKYKNSDSSLFLACLLYKEIERTQTLVDFNRFVDDCLAEINRPELQLKFKEIINKQQKVPKQKKSQQKDTRSEYVPSSPETEERMRRLEETSNMILEKVNGIDDKINSAQQYGMPYESSDSLFSSFGSKPYPPSMGYSQSDIFKEATKSKS